MKFHPNTIFSSLPVQSVKRIEKQVSYSNTHYSFLLQPLGLTNSHAQKETAIFLVTRQRIRDKIDSFRTLKENWNQNNAEPFDEKLLDIVQEITDNLTQLPKVFPTARQTIQLEFEKENGDYLEFEIGLENTMLLTIVNDKETEKTVRSDFKLFNEIIDKFYAC